MSRGFLSSYFPGLRTVVFAFVTGLLPLTAFANVDLVVNNADSPDPVPATGVVTYTVRVTSDETGNETATNVKTVHAVSAGATYEGFAGTGVTCTGMTTGQAGPGTLNCSLPDLAVGQESVFTIRLKSSSIGNISLGATVSSAQVDTESSNDTLNESTTVNAGANVAVSATPSPGTAPSGSVVSLNLSVSNAGPNPATNLVVTTPVPTGLNVTTVPTGCVNSGSVVTCTIAGPIAPGGSLPLGSITGQITAAGSSTISSTSSVQVSGTAPPGTPQDPDVSDNTDVANITVTAGSDLRITKARSVSGNLLVGQALDFVLTPTYSGDSPGAITVTDTVPANYTIGTVSASQNGWACNVAGQTVTCTRAGGGVAGLNQPLGVITIPVTAATAGSPTNSANISSGTIDPTPANNTANDGGVTILAPTVNLGVNKAGPSPALVVRGVPFDYRITANNTGTTGYFGTMTVTDNLPDGLTVNAYTLNGWSCSPAAPVTGPASISCSRAYTSGAPLGVNQTTPAAILNVTASIDGAINNNATITADCNLGTGNCGDGDIASYVVTSSVTTDSADVRLLKSVAGPTTVAAGDVLTYRLEVVNAGTAVSQDVQLTDTFDTLINDNIGAAGAGYIGHVITNGGGGTCNTVSASGGTGRRLSCSFPSIPVCTPGSNCPVVTVEVRPGGDGGSRTNTANAVSLGTADPDHSNDEASAGATIDPRADVTVTKTANPGTVAAGQPLTYVVTASNVANGLSAAGNVTITDTLPLDVTFVSATPSAGSCSTMPVANSTTAAGNRTVTCNLGTVNNGSQRTVSIIVRPNNATRGTTITNNVSVATSTTEIDTTNNTASVNATVTVPSLDLVMNKVDTVDPVAVGDATAYTLTVSNSGPSAAENVIVNDPLPTTGQLTFQSASVTTGTGTCGTVPAVDAAGGLVSCNLGYLPAGTTRTITINMKGAAKGVYTNSATVLSDESVGGFDTNTSNNTDGETTTVRTKADMEVVSKVPSQASVNLRDDFNFKITVRNNGPLNEADDVEVTDNLPAGMELTAAPTVNVVSGTTTQSTCTGSAGTTTQFKCSLGTVSLNAVIEITVPVQLVSLSGGSSTQTFTNQATVSTSSLDSVSGNNTKTGAVTVDSSTLSGRVFGDVDNDGVFNGSDVGLAGVTVTLTGTSFDGVSITRTATTDASGNYTFTGVPQGTYQVQEGTVTATHYVDGIDTAGTVGGDTSVNDRISNINLPANTAATGYNFAEKPVPLIGIAKQAGAVVNNLDGTYDVPFTLTIANAGKTPLSAVQINDTVAGQFGTYTADAPVAGQYTISSGPAVTMQVNGASVAAVAAGVFTGSGAGSALLVPASSALPNYGAGTASSARITFTVRFFPTTSGPFNNTATVTGVSPTNETVTDNSIDGAAPDANNNDDPTDDTSPTVVNLAGQAIGIAKSVGTVLQTGPKRFRVPYTLTVQNISATVTATNVQVTDSLNATFPTAQSITISSPAAIGACTGTVLNVASPAFNGTTQTRLLTGNQNLQHGERCTITFTTEIDFGVNPLPAVVQNNQATATTSQTPGGTVIATDLSNDGVDIDPNSNGNAGDGGENVPTPVNFGPGSMSSVQGTVYLDSNHDRANNDGASVPNVAGFIVEVLNGAGEIVGTATTAADGTYTISGLRPSTSGETNTYYTLRFREPASGLVYGVSQSNDPDPARNGMVKDGEITQLQLAPGATTINQDLPLDPSGVVYDSVSRNPVSGATVTITSGGAPVPGTCVVGSSNTQVTGVAGMYQFLLINPVPPGCPGAATYTLEVTQPAGYLPPPSSSIPPTAATYTPTGGGVDAIQAQVGPPAGAQPTTYYFSFQLTPGASSNVVNNHIPLDPILNGAIIVSKTTPLVNVVRSDLVPYTVTATNTLASTLPGIEVVDNIPAGFRYKVGSATLNGVHVEPTVSGRRLTWLSQTFGPSERKTIRLLLVVGTGVSEGEYVNQALARNTVANAQVSNLATATVRVVPDPTFDCSDIIGKVFDDQNANGYQDEGEPGIPNVRVATARGLLVTTDHEGRFHVACADIPNADRGANFVMKLDERTLPSGYRVTTENPRDVRVTRGKMTKLNFGATVHRVMRLELSGAAFDGSGTQLQAAYAAELDKLPAQLQERPSVLRIAYRRGAEPADLAQKRIAAVSDRIRELWKEKRRREEEDDKPLVPLMIETEMEAAQ